MFDEERPRYAEHARQFLHQYLDAAPSAASVAEKIEKLIDADKLYNALRATQDLMDHESERLGSIGMGASDEDDRTKALEAEGSSGQPGGNGE